MAEDKGKFYGGRWRQGKQLGEGGQGRTYMVTDTIEEIPEPCVAKELKPERLDEQGLKRFRDEINAMSRLSHENIVKLIDYNIDGSAEPFLIVEYCEGLSLADREPFWRGDPGLTIELFQQICEGVNHAHVHGVVHRDIYPSNIFLRRDDTPAVGDFGICYYLDSIGSRATVTGEAVGPRHYTAPELESGPAHKVTDKCDTYSLGKLLYWLFAGKAVPREQYREPEFDLKGRRDDTRMVWPNVHLEHINDALDRMIKYNPNERLSVGQVSAKLPNLRRVLEGNYAPIGTHLAPPCNYCGQGHYRAKVPNMIDADNFGLKPRTPAKWLVLACDYCGNLEWFRVEYARSEIRALWETR